MFILDILKDIPPGIIFGLIAMVFYGLCYGVTKIAAIDMDSLKIAFWNNIFISLLTAASLPLLQKKITLSVNHILIVLLLSFLGYIALTSFYKALSTGSVGIVSTVSNSCVIFTILFSVLFFKERLSKFQSIAIVVILCGIILISIDVKNIRNSNFLKLSSGIPYAALTCLLWGLIYCLIKIPLEVLGPFFSPMVFSLGVVVYSAVHMKITKRPFMERSPRLLGYVFLQALFATIATVAYNMGIQITEISIVASITFTAPWVTALYGKYVYKEKLSTQQWAAILIILCGIVILCSF